MNHYVAALTLQSGVLDDEAIAVLVEAVKVDQKFSLAQSMLGTLYRKQGKLDLVAAAFEKACRLDPWSFPDHLNLGQAYQGLKRYNEAITALKRACVAAQERRGQLRAGRVLL